MQQSYVVVVDLAQMFAFFWHMLHLIKVVLIVNSAIVYVRKPDKYAALNY